MVLELYSPLSAAIALQMYSDTCGQPGQPGQPGHPVRSLSQLAQDAPGCTATARIAARSRRAAVHTLMPSQRQRGAAARGRGAPLACSCGAAHVPNDAARPLPVAPRGADDAAAAGRPVPHVSGMQQAMHRQALPGSTAHV